MICVTCWLHGLNRRAILVLWGKSLCRQCANRETDKPALRELHAEKGGSGRE